eukprot:TRINITY_DN782_c0_g1_i2.p1 TRINITY_DN782_c0_g1~~TRINITY_DN782_c0_g1_i2.p1  ORF type:complete len:356 (+),score=62.11 TRINITY_DN782_c0_g1_i2:60-1127(+)
MLFTRAAVRVLSRGVRAGAGAGAGLPKSAVAEVPARTGNLLPAIRPNYCRRLSVMASHVSGDGDGGKTLAAGVAAAAAGIAVAACPDQSQAEAATAKTALDPSAFVSFKLQEVVTLNHNTKLFRFEIPQDMELGLPVASCVVTRAQVGVDANGKPSMVIRPYTPVSDPAQKGFFELLIKVYPNGKMTQYMDKLVPGETLDVKGPITKIPYTANMKKRIGMICGGSGITPMFQVLDRIAKNPDDSTQVTLVFANVSEGDILLRKELDRISFSHPNVKVFYVIDRPVKGWEGGVGYITEEMLRKAMPPPSDDNLIMVCGPPGMMRHISGDKLPDKSQGEVSGLLAKMGYTKNQVFKF